MNTTKIEPARCLRCGPDSPLLTEPCLKHYGPHIKQDPRDEPDNGDVSYLGMGAFLPPRGW